MKHWKCFIVAGALFALNGVSATERKDWTVRCGDGYEGWPDASPFDLILVACAPLEPPQALIEQLAPEGRLIVPVGQSFMQELVAIEKRADGTSRRTRECAVAFVPMVRESPAS